MTLFQSHSTLVTQEKNLENYNITMNFQSNFYNFLHKSTIFTFRPYVLSLIIIEIIELRIIGQASRCVYEFLQKFNVDIFTYLF